MKFNFFNSYFNPFTSGQETTSAALSFMLAEAAKNPEVENK